MKKNKNQTLTFEEEEKKDIDPDTLFDKYDSNKDGKLDGDEISSLILELFDPFRTEEPIQESSSIGETVKSVPSEDEMQKLDSTMKDICPRNVTSALSKT